jgi:nitroreductase
MKRLREKNHPCVQKGASEEQLRRIMVAGTKAPSAVNRQPWEFILVQDQKLIDQLAEIKFQQNKQDPPQRVKGDPAAAERLAQAQKDSFRNASIIAVCHLVDWERACGCASRTCLSQRLQGLGSGIVMYWGEKGEGSRKGPWRRKIMR